MKSMLFTAAAALSLTAAYAQETSVPAGDYLKCSTNEMLRRQYAAMGLNYDTDASTIYYEQEIQQIIRYNNEHPSERSGPYVIPIVFHIVHIGGAENISDAQVYDAVRILNRDYAKQNADTVDVVTPFKGIIADVGFEFRLAQKDALGNCVSGITRTFSSTTNNGDQDMVDKVNLDINGGTSTSNIRYPRDKYLNVWVCKNAAGAAGYTSNPSSWLPAEYDGIWIGYNYVGAIGASSELTSRALTHEVGHWFNLQHVWGNTNNPGVSCGDDAVSDTPITKGWTTCNLTSNDVCNPGSPENVQNYMDYSYCSRMFTNGQKSRMVASITSSTASRNNIWKASNLTLTGVAGPDNLCAADFISDQTVVCAGSDVHFTDASFHGPTSWSWTFDSGTPGTSGISNPTVTYNTVGQYNVTLTSSNASGSQSTTKTSYVTVIDPVGAAIPFSEGFESTTSFPNTEWFITNSDGEQAWQLYTGTGATGTKCVKLDNFAFNNTGAKDDILSNTFDLSSASSVLLTFKYAYKKRTSADVEKLKVYVSNNCGQSWSLRKQLTGTALGSGVSTSAFTPTASDWQTFDVTNITSAYFTQGFRFKIEFESASGNNIYIDDINLMSSVGISEITADNLAFNVYPNPVNANATIDYTIANSSKVEVRLTDVVGQTIAVLENNVKAAGSYKLPLNSANLTAKGVYFVTLQAGNIKQTRKIVVE